MISICFLIVLFFSAFIALQVLIYRAIVRNALRKYIEPELKEKGLLFIGHKWPGLLSNGDFEADNISLRINTNGRQSNSLYVYIYYKKLNDTKKITARIDTTFWFIDSVIYSSAF